MNYTATEALMRQNEWWLKHGDNLARISRQMATTVLDSIINTKVPLIKYGRQKRQYRRLFPRTDHIKVTFDLSPASKQEAR